MTKSRTSPSYQGRSPASSKASAAARGASRKRDTRPEILLRRELWRAGCRYLVDVAALPGRPDIVFRGPKLAVFCDGDFWHGRDWEARRRKLAAGSNAAYWVAKIARNIERDALNTALLRDRGWTVARVWESDITADTERVVAEILGMLGAKS